MNGIKNVWYIPTMKCSSAIKRNDVRHATPWMNFENMLSDGNKS